MPYDEARLSRMLKNEADPGNRHRVRAVLEYLDIRTGERVLDCGCGLGWFLKVIGELHDCRRYGIDLDPARLARAAAELGPGAALAVAAAGRLPFSSATFDKIVMSEVLEHLEDDFGALVEVGRVLEPGGIVAITVPNRRYPFWWDPVNRSRERMGLAPIRQGLFGGIWTNHLRLYSPDDILALVRRAGFIVEDCRTLVRHCLPFAHNLVYGVGKPLVESGLLRSADRFRYAESSSSALHPLNWARGLINAIDRTNAGLPPDAQPAVGIAVKARKG